VSRGAQGERFVREKEGEDKSRKKGRERGGKRVADNPN